MESLVKGLGSGAMRQREAGTVVSKLQKWIPIHSLYHFSPEGGNIRELGCGSALIIVWATCRQPIRNCG